MQWCGSKESFCGLFNFSFFLFVLCELRIYKRKLQIAASIISSFRYCIDSAGCSTPEKMLQYQKTFMIHYPGSRERGVPLSDHNKIVFPNHQYPGWDMKGNIWFIQSLRGDRTFLKRKSFSGVARIFRGGIDLRNGCGKFHISKVIAICYRATCTNLI